MAKVAIRYYASQGMDDTTDRCRIIEVVKDADRRTISERWTGKIAGTTKDAAALVQSLNRRFAFSPNFHGSEVATRS